MGANTELTTTSTMLEPPFQSNGILSGTDTDERPAEMTAREELEMMSTGILDGSMEDEQVMRRLEVSQGTNGENTSDEQSATAGEAGNKPPMDMQEEFSENGFFGGMIDTAHKTETHRSEDTMRTIAKLGTTTAVKAATPSAATIDEFQGNGILGGDLQMMDEPMEEERSAPPTAGVEDDPVDTAFEANGLLGDFEPLPAAPSISSPSMKTVSETAAAIPNGTTDGNHTELGTSSLDKLLDELDSAGYTAAEKGKGRADAARRAPTPASTAIRSALPSLGEPETPTDGESLFPGMNLVLMTDEVEKLKPLEAVDGRGRKVVFKRKPRKVVDGKGPRPESMTGTGKGLKLLETSYHDLLKEIEEEQSAKAAQALQKQYEEEDRALAPVPIPNGKKESKVCEVQQAKKEAAKRTMWVDKYRPTKFTDLLGEERSHRDVLGWLKEWDKCVYKRVNPLQSRKRARETEELGAGGYSDVLGRPKERVLLMSGPPGLGKTTLAHVVARQAGYEVFEINASDDRNAGTVSQRIKNALDAGSGLRSKGKPTCVVIDEIDGSAGGDMGFIRSLCHLIQDVPARKNSKKAPQILKRPIICICNDLYAPALRPLRPFARIVRFKKPQPALIVNRLRQICDKEKIKADIRGLTRLAEMTNGDVRSCLNTLQFMKSRSMAITEKSIRQSSIGMKDSGASLHAVWNSLFVPVSTKGKRKQNGIGAVDNYVNRLAFEVQSCGDQDKVVQGCFEHYPNLKPMDQSLNNLCKIHEWLHFYDQLHQRILSSQEWELMAYTAYAIVPWHSHLASSANMDRPVEYPKADYESYVKSSTNKDVGTALLKSIPPSLRALYNSSSALTELVPMLMRIVSPNLKPVNANLVRAEDKILLTHLVELMLGLNLVFYRDKTEDGQPMFRLDPPIDVFIHYDGKRAADIAQSRFAVRQLVSQAMEAETLKRKGGANAEGADKNEVHSIFKQREKAEKPNLADKPPTDFFGRLVKSSEAKLNEAKGSTAKEFRILYKYNEGSSSALRKTVKMSSMM